jgi:hypothetical protein
MRVTSPSHKRRKITRSSMPRNEVSPVAPATAAFSALGAVPSVDALASSLETLREGALASSTTAAVAASIAVWIAGLDGVGRAASASLVEATGRGGAFCGRSAPREHAPATSAVAVRAAIAEEKNAFG